MLARLDAENDFCSGSGKSPATSRLPENFHSF
jgi:hypothetical protein